MTSPVVPAEPAAPTKDPAEQPLRPDLFVSYSRLDERFVMRLVDALASRGKDVWVDREDIRKGADWRAKVLAGIDSARVIVPVLSPDFAASKVCGEELDYAAGHNKRLVPILFRRLQGAEVRAEVKALNWVLFDDEARFDEATEELVEAIETDLDWLDEHARLLVRALEWKRAEGKAKQSLLARGSELRTAEDWLATQAGHREQATREQVDFIVASRRAANRRQRITVGAVLIALAVSILLGVVAILQRNDARGATRRATSTALAAAANARLSTRPDQSLLLALAAYASSPSADARSAAFGAVEQVRKLGVIELVHGDSPVSDVAFAPDGRTLAVGSADGSVRLSDTRTRRQIATLVESGSPIVAVGFARRGRVVAAGSADGRVRLWDVGSGKPVADLDARHPIVASAVSEDGRKAAAMNKDGRIWLWDVGNGGARRLRGNPSTAAELAFSPDSRTLAAATTYDSGNSIEGYVELYDVGSGKQRELPNDSDAVDAIAFSPDGRTLLTGGSAGTEISSHGELQLWDARRPGRRAIASFEKGAAIDAISFGRRGRTFVAGREDGSVVSAAATPGGWQRLDTKVRVPGSVTSLALGRGGTVAVVPQGAATVRVVSLAGRVPFGRVIGRLNELGYPGNLAFSRTGQKTVVAADGDAGALVMPLDGGKPRWLAPPLRGGSIDGVAVRRDGSVIGTSVTTASLTSSQSWNLSTHKRLPLIPDTSEDAKVIGRRAGVNDPFLAIVAKDGHTFAIGDGDGRIWLWDSRRSDPATLLGGNAEATGKYTGSPALAFSPDGKTLAVGGPFRFWDVSSRKPLGSPLSGAYLDALEFSPNGRALASVDDGDSAVRLWESIPASNLNDLRAQICNLVAGDLTRHEWESIATGIAYRRSCSR